VRVLAFSTTLVTSELEVINHPLSSVREGTASSFWCTPCNLQGDVVSQHHEALEIQYILHTSLEIQYITLFLKKIEIEHDPFNN
jgi:hypothetical protein